MEGLENEEIREGEEKDGKKGRRRRGREERDDVLQTSLNYILFGSSYVYGWLEIHWKRDSLIEH